MGSLVHWRWLAVAGALAAGAPAWSQYPVKPVRLIVPFPAGSANDLVARFVAPALSDALGRQVLIDNRAGAAGNLGADVAAKSPPDGYTLMMANIAHAISMTLYDKLPYDLARDFAPVSLLAAGSFMLAVHPSVPVKSVRELIAVARARPGHLNVAVSGAGIILAAELFRSMARVKMTQVSYKGSPQAATALVSGEVSVGFPSTSIALPQVKAARLKGLAVTSAQRSPIAPDVATMAEAGLPGYEATPWYGLAVPAATPRDIVSRLHGESMQALKRPEVKERFAATDIVPLGTTPEEFGAYIRAEIAKWGKLIKTAGLRPE
jgi:tripartite-type tricarboxylate transporter receptor subunit TctC